jgi:hypothetical protein
MNPEKFPDAVEKVESLHDLYQRSTGFRYRLDYARIRAWHDFIQGGFSQTDLALVIGYLRKKIAARDRQVGALKFSNLITALDRFEDDLNVAREESRILRGQKPATTQTTQKVGDTTRTVTVPRATEEDTVNVSGIFASIRDEINRQQKAHE